jgi:hypothetical protein
VLSRIWAGYASLKGQDGCKDSSGANSFRCDEDVGVRGACSEGAWVSQSFFCHRTTQVVHGASECNAMTHVHRTTVAVANGTAARLLLAYNELHTLQVVRNLRK